MDFPMDQVIGRYSKDEGLPLAAAKEHERELKRYLLLCALNPSEHYGMRGPIDKLWHTFLVFTKDYAKFSDEVAGRFLHHDPVVEDVRNGTSPSHYLRTLSDYEQVFGEEAPRHIWPRLHLPLKAATRSGPSGHLCELSDAVC
jgi:hypothetical protein